MAQEPEGRDTGQDNRWKYPTAAIIILIVLGLAVYQTIKTGEIPYTIVGPILVAALAALFTFKISDFTGGGKG